MNQDFVLSGGVLEQQFNNLPKTTCHSWHDIIFDEFMRDRKRYIALDRELSELYNNKIVNPQKENIFRAFRECSLEQTCAAFGSADR